MKKIRLLIFMVLLPFAGNLAHSQTDAQLAHYFEAPSFYNPGALGNTDLLRIRVGSRMQWVGIDNAPVSFVGVADMPVKIGSRRLGVGVSLQQESLGLYRNLTVGFQIGYKIKLFGGTLTPGLRIGFLNETFRGSEVVLPDDDDFHEGTDDAIPTTDVAGNAFDLGVGLFFVNKKWWAGLSALHVNSPTVTFSTDNVAGSVTSRDGENPPGSPKNYEFKADPTLYFMCGGNIPVNNTLFEVIPSLMVKSDLSFTTGELAARLRYKKFITAGVGYRYDDAIMLLLGVEYKGFYVGYSYDYPASAISKASSGSHEIMAGYSLKLDFSEKNRNKHKSIRIM